MFCENRKRPALEEQKAKPGGGTAFAALALLAKSRLVFLHRDSAGSLQGRPFTLPLDTLCSLDPLRGLFPPFLCFPFIPTYS